MENLKRVENLIGNTPLYELKKLKQILGFKGNIFAKLEFQNPGGSVKDRAAKFMLDDAEKKGLISNGATIIEPTSGNTGIGLAMIGRERGYKVVLTMPDTMSVERRKMLQDYGATVVLTDGNKGMQGSVEKALEIHKNTPNSYIPGQFENPANTLAHYVTTGPEIWAQSGGNVDVFIAGVGSGATLSGVGKYLKEKNKKIRVCAVEPQSSPLISQGVSGAHKIQGIGANFIPKNFDKSVCDDVLTCSDDDAFKYAKMLIKTEDLPVGISSGAAFFAAVEIAKKEEYADKNLVIILPDSSNRYYSTLLFE